MSERRCANETCACRPVASRIFCCSLCAASTLHGSEPPEACTCGHPECTSLGLRFRAPSAPRVGETVSVVEAGAHGLQTPKLGKLRATTFSGS